jgi:rhodanese-related sulfurtransferase
MDGLAAWLVVGLFFGSKSGARQAGRVCHSKIMGDAAIEPPPTKGFKVKFLIDNWMLFAIALASGGMLLWPMISGAIAAGGLTASGAVQLINRERAVVVDVSEPDEFAAGHVGGAKNVPLGELEAKLPLAVKNKNLPLILVCASGARASRAAATAKKLGYEQAQALGGGLKAWKDANLPVEKA